MSLLPFKSSTRISHSSQAPALILLLFSFEFFAFPEYFTNLSTPTDRCLSNWQALTGTWPPIRIGGTTQDRAQYDPTTSEYVVYTVASSADAPDSLTFGSSFMTLAGQYDGNVVLGLNRGKNNISNTIAAAKVGVSQMSNLLAIELGNEPECECILVEGHEEMMNIDREMFFQTGRAPASRSPRGYHGHPRQMQHLKITGTSRWAVHLERRTLSRLVIQTRLHQLGAPKSLLLPRTRL